MRFDEGDVLVIRGTREAMEFFGLKAKLRSGDPELEEAIREAKNDAEMSLYLGYSALLYDSKGLAQGALRFYERAKRRLEKAVFSILQRRSEEELRASTLEVLEVIRQVGESGVKLAQTVRGEGELNVVMDIADDETKEQFVLLKVEEDSIWHDRTIGELNLDDRLGVRIIAVKRGGRWLFDPREELKLKRGDILLISGYEPGIESIEEVGEELKGEK